MPALPSGSALANLESVIIFVGGVIVLILLMYIAYLVAEYTRR